MSTPFSKYEASISLLEKSESYKLAGWRKSPLVVPTDAAIAWGAAFDGNPEDAAPLFDRFCEQQGIDPLLADLGVTWHAQVAEHGIEVMPQPVAPPSAYVARRLREIEQEMQKPRSESRYWHDADMRDEYLALLERGERSTGASPLPSNDSARRAEIEQIMREDRDRYFRDDTLQNEFSQILERESAPEFIDTSETAEEVHGQSSNG